VYALVKLGLLLDDGALLSLAARAAAWITPEAIARDETLDVLGGSAGAILGLLALFRVSQDPELLRRAGAAGEHLLERRVRTHSGHRAWKSVGPEPLTGFAHGAAGIAHALGRLHAETGDGRFAQAATEGVAFERSVYLPALAHPPESTPGERLHPWYMLNWCHGATGIGLARLGLDAALPGGPSSQDVDAALRAVQEWGLQEVDHACCGNAGRSELLLVASRRLGRPELAALARRRAAWMADRARLAGGYTLFPDVTTRVQSPGWFQGTAGIGYHFLRLAHPELPCVLLFD
jgi:lantibiotic modifying enzyme